MIDSIDDPHHGLPVSGGVSNTAANDGVQIGTNVGTVTVTRAMMPSGSSDESLLRAYLVRLYAACNMLVFGDPLGGRLGRPMELAKVFTMLKVGQGINVTSALESERTCMLLGEPGGGKTTALAFLSLALIEAQTEFLDIGEGSAWARLQDEMWLETSSRITPIPIRVRLKEVSQSLWDGVPEIRHGLLGTEECKRLIILLEEHLQNGTALFLLDGLDEVPIDRLKVVLKLIRDTCSHFRRSRIVISCRTFDYQNDYSSYFDGFPNLTLQRFDLQAQEEFVDRWYSELVRTGRRTEIEAEVKRQNLMLVLREREELRELAQIPLLLALVALVHTEEGGLPSACALLYQRCIRLLLLRWRPTEGINAALDEGRLLTLTTELGYLAHYEEQQKGKTFRGLSREQVRQVAMQFFDRGVKGEKARQRAEQLGLSAAHRLLNSNGLLQQVSYNHYGFAHRTFQEFLAGQYLGVGSRFQKALKHAADPYWRVALLLMAGYGAREGTSLDYLMRLVSVLLKEGRDQIILAAEILVEIGQETLRDKGYDDVLDQTGLWQEVTNHLRDIAFYPIHHPDPGTRNYTAILLDKMDADKRLSLELEHPSYWTQRIQPGPFLMGDDNGKYDEEKPAFISFIQQPYALARYPVTNRQYLHFLEALERRDRRVEAVRRCPAYWPGKSFPSGEGNHPVVGVSWEDACAFALWAEEQLREAQVLHRGETIRLPLETEWERAAAYPVLLKQDDLFNARREYTWGNQPYSETSSDSSPCNTKESGIGSTSVVGIFPQSVVECGAEELTGNVLEWCSSTYEEYPLTSNIAAESIYTHEDYILKTYVLRGGAWNYSQGEARCTCRIQGVASYRNKHVGFRLVRVFSA